MPEGPETSVCDGMIDQQGLVSGDANDQVTNHLENMISLRENIVGPQGVQYLRYHKTLRPLYLFLVE